MATSSFTNRARMGILYRNNGRWFVYEAETLQDEVAVAAARDPIREGVSFTGWTVISPAAMFDSETLVEVVRR